MPGWSNKYAKVSREGGFRSGLEKQNAALLKAIGTPFEYETHTVHYIVPETKHRYKPDFVLPNGIVIETKGEWETADRKKHKLIRAQYPDLDVRLVFGNPNATIGKKSKTTYAMYCQRLGIPFAAKRIPYAWVNEKPDKRRLEALKKATTSPPKDITPDEDF